MAEERAKYQSECETLSKNLVEKSQLCDALKQEVADQKGENVVMKRKLELKLRVIRILYGKKHFCCIISSPRKLPGSYISAGRSWNTMKVLEALAVTVVQILL